MQSHLHRFVVELLHECLWDLHFCTYGKVELTFLHEANLENQCWKEGMWEGIHPAVQKMWILIREAPSVIA